MNTTKGYLTHLSGKKDYADSRVEAIVTIPPYAPYIVDIAEHPLVTGVRLNTVMPVKESLEYLLTRIQKQVRGKDIWIDLKTRQIRVTNYATTPYQHLEISHKIKIDTPVEAFFDDGTESATLAQVVDGNKLIMLDGPKRVVGPGESINIVDSSLEIEEFLTDTDKRYIQAAKKVGINTYMASYIEKEDDITEILNCHPEAEILAKIESKKGLKLAEKYTYAKENNVHLMAARGDLYVEVGKPHKIVKAVRDIVRKDPEAVIASRLFPSFQRGQVPSSQDIFDAAYLLEIGYKRFMIGDDVCFRKESVMSALNLLDAIAKDYALMR